MTTLSGHLTDAMAQRLVDGLLDDGQDAGAEAHARGCAECAALVESYRVLGQALDGLDVPELPGDFTAAVLQRIEASELIRARERHQAATILMAVLTVAAGVLVAAGAGGLATTVGAWADGLGEASRAFQVGRGVLPGLISALRLPLLLGASALALPLLFGLARLMPAPHARTI
jgi:anti-sigma factor RsiW